MSITRGDLVAKISKAASFSEQAALVSQLDAFDQHRRAEAGRARELDLAAAVVQQTLMPVRVHEMHTAATDWIADFEPNVDMSHHASIAEAAMWFGRTSSDVKADQEEFGIQAEGFMRREASRYGEQAQAVYAEGLSYLGFLYRRLAASGLDQIQQTVDPHDSPKTTEMPTDVFDNFAPEVCEQNAGVVGTETSERNPLLQEIMSGGNGSGSPEKPGGHSTQDDFSGGYSEVPAGSTEDNSSGPLGGIEAPGEGQAEEEDQHDTQDAHMGSWDGRSVAISHTMNLDQFRASQAKEAASGLDQVQQTVNPHEDPAPTPLPAEVMFPWMISPDAYGTQGENGPSSSPSPDQAANQGNPYVGKRKQAAYEPSANPTPVSWNKNAARPCNDCKGAQPSKDCMNCRGTGSKQEKGIGTSSRRKQADMFGNSDAPHAVPGPNVANTPATTPIPREDASYDKGFEDAEDGDAPTFADHSSDAKDNVSQYDKGYEDGMAQLRKRRTPNYPVSVNHGNTGIGLGFGGGFGVGGFGGHGGIGDGDGNMNDDGGGMGGDMGGGGDGGGGDSGSGGGGSEGSLKTSSRFVKEASRKNPDFTKGYGFATQWAPDKPLVTMGSAEFESGLFAGMIDHSAHQVAWVEAHRRQASKDKRFARRMSTYSKYMAHLASKGISLEAATSTDLDTMDPSASPSPSGQTPINGQGNPGPLAGGNDPAAPGGPSPYNGAEPFGHEVVPGSETELDQPGSDLVNDVVGGPADGNLNRASIAFRKNVQASLLASRKG